MKLFWTYKRFPAPWRYVFLIGGFVLPIFTGILIANQAKKFYEVFAMAYPMGIIFYFVIARLLTLWLMNKKTA
ncbi:MAG: hypothetical protein RLZZ414_1849 [Bacteroidota bacterium]|jgi:hypothetical protein